eukprot:4825849-Prymnesium_polylepis.1
MCVFVTRRKSCTGAGHVPAEPIRITIRTTRSTTRSRVSQNKHGVGSHTLLAASCLAAHAAASNQGRVHLVDAQLHSFLFRGPNPVDAGVFNATGLLDTLRFAASSECAVTLPPNFTLVS